MAVFELACLSRLRRLSLVRVHNITDLGIFALAEQATQLERLHLSYCDQVSLDSIHLLLRKLRHLQHLTATGIPALRRLGVDRFSDPPPLVSHHARPENVANPRRDFRLQIESNKQHTGCSPGTVWRR